MIKFIFVGPESTGKSTLCKYLSSFYGVPYVREMCRVMAEERAPAIMDASSINFEFCVEDFIKMAAEQNAEELAATKLALDANKRFIICDNDAFAVNIWCERYLGTPLSIGVPDDGHKRIYILTKPNVPFVQDGYRDGEHIREWMYERFLQELKKQGLKYYVLDSPDYSMRDIRARSIIKENYFSV
jgi:HTH-type transcriptional repressor of NAD biosynthesis genes